MDFDQVLEKCGSFGRYQFLLLLLFGYINILSAWHYFGQTIISFTPEHWCDHPKLRNFSTEDLRGIYDAFERPSCTLLSDYVNGTPIVESQGQCKTWRFEYESGYETITTELSWVCDNAYQSAVGQSMYFVGSVIGTIFFGILADRIGRLPALVMTALSGATGDFLTSYVTSLPWYAASRLLTGVSTDTIYYLMFIMVFEYVSPKRRTFALNITMSSFYCFGVVISPWTAIWIGNWRKFLLLVSLPALGVLLYPLLICESAQWLLTKKKYDKAVNCLKRVAKINGRHVDESVFDEFVKFYEEKITAEEKLCDRKDTFLGMFRTPRLRKFTIILLIKSMIITLAFDIMSRNVEGLGTSPFKLLSYSGLAYFPAGFTLILFQNMIGRKGMACASLLGGGIIAAVTGVLITYLDPNEHATLLAIMVSLGRYGGTLAYDAEAQYGAEIIPTSVRGRGMSNIHVMGYAFNFLSPYVIYLGNFYKPFPAIFVSLIMFVGAALCLTLPETMHKKLPDTLTDGERFGLDEKWYFFSCWSRKHDKNTESKMVITT